ncbi:MAG: sirohydrochlorin cobaltochelatase [Treponema sp.]|nr:sirohydrochlorin cobaltochelatase [Treponema sp.]
MNTLLSLTAIILVSFGTSFESSRQATIVAVEKEVQAAYPEAHVTSAYTSTMIRNKLLKRDGTKVFSVEEALADAVSKGCKNVIIQPTHMMYGLEYNEMKELAAPYESKFEKVVYGEPLMATTEDISLVLKALADANPLAKKQALVLMGHGTEYFSNFLYAATDYQAKLEGYPNIFVGTVEAFPACEDVIALVKAAKYKSVVLTPLMLVAGDHANNDMAGDEDDSWKTQFTKAGFKVDTLIKGLGEYPEIRKIYVEHVATALAALKGEEKKD